ncbi:hypothetical protein [Chromohalobacter sp. 296-RDG]|uniref:Orn/Lys/Arg family decarboxylase n=1 Tax=Chromohalobacter sp. 296-RDG TaxID=2994062 RepID=UPI0024683798|nr:hypothetical protein [Chromohalobacter sp. 296-RDG]
MTYPIYFYRAAHSAMLKQLISFHTLPLSNLKSLSNSRFEDKYLDLMSSNYEMSVTEPFIDSIASLNSVLKDAEKEASRTFGTDSTLFICSGSTVSNQIAVAASCSSESRIIIQKGLHQSFHFTINSTQVKKKTYIDDIEIDETTGKTSLNVKAMLDEIICAEENKNGYDVAIINSQTYEGIQQKLDEILPLLLKHGPSLKKIIIDEAWGAWSNFSTSLSRHCAIDAAKNLRSKYEVDFIITHSAHKSLFACRQASYLHCIGGEEAIEKLKQMRYRLHTTSPNYRHLTSLDLAQCHARIEGRMFSDRAEANARLLKKLVKEKLTLFLVISSTKADFVAQQNYATSDQTKVWLDISELNITGSRLREILYKEHNIYVSRYTESCVLFNIHFGITQENLNALIRALQTIEEKNKWCISQLREDTISEYFVIPYPPGVPIVVPGERISKLRLQKIKKCIVSGVSMKFL